MADKSGQVVPEATQDSGALRKILVSIMKLMEKNLSADSSEPAETNGIDSHNWASMMQIRDVFHGKSDAAPLRSKEQW